MSATSQNRIRKIIPSLDGDGRDVLLLSDASTVAVYTRGGGTVPLYSLRGEERMELPNAPIDAAWCPYKQADTNASYLVTAWGAPVQLVDVEDGLPRACYYVSNTMDEVCYAQSLLWLRAPNRQEQFVGGYGRSLQCCIALFDVLREGKSPIFEYEPTSAKCCNYSADAASANVVVSALAEIRSNLVAFGTLRGSVELVDLRSRCCAGAIGGAMASGSSSSYTSSLQDSAIVRHTAGIVQILPLDGSTVLSCNSSDATKSCATAPDDHHFVTVPRAGDDNILVWDMRNLSNPTTIINRGGGAARTGDNTYRGVGVLGGGDSTATGRQLVIPTQSSGLSVVPFSAIFGSPSSSFPSPSRIDAGDYTKSSPGVSTIQMPAGTLTTPAPSTTSLNAGDSHGRGVVAVLGATVMVGDYCSLRDTSTCRSGADGLARRKYIAAGDGVGLLGAKRTSRSTAGGAEADAANADDEDETDYVVLRSRRVFGNAATMLTVELSDGEC